MWKSIDDVVLMIKSGSCNNAMCRGNMPVQAKANGLDLDRIPNELKDLNTLKLRMISLMNCACVVLFIN